MKTINFDDSSTDAVHLLENVTSFILLVELPEGLTFHKHLGKPEIELSEKKIVVVQKVLCDSEGLNFKFKLNSEAGRVDLKFKAKALVGKGKEQFLAHLDLIIPLLISNSGKKEEKIRVTL